MRIQDQKMHSLFNGLYDHSVLGEIINVVREQPPPFSGSGFSASLGGFNSSRISAGIDGLIRENQTLSNRLSWSDDNTNYSATEELTYNDFFDPIERTFHLRAGYAFDRGLKMNL